MKTKDRKCNNELKKFKKILKYIFLLTLIINIMGCTANKESDQPIKYQDILNEYKEMKKEHTYSSSDSYIVNNKIYNITYSVNNCNDLEIILSRGLSSKQAQDYTKVTIKDGNNMDIGITYKCSITNDTENDPECLKYLPTDQGADYLMQDILKHTVNY